jgi:hypothetical protein
VKCHESRFVSLFDWRCAPPRGRAIPRVSKVLIICLSLLPGACASPNLDGPSMANTSRSDIVLQPDERAHFLAGMRAYLEATQGIVDGLAAGNMDSVAESARKAGVSALADASPSLAVKLPGEFVVLSLDTHQKFDLIAQAAEAHSDSKEILQQLGVVLSNCSSCHAAYHVAL